MLKSVLEPNTQSISMGFDPIHIKEDAERLKESLMHCEGAQCDNCPARDIFPDGQSCIVKKYAAAYIRDLESRVPEWVCVANEPPPLCIPVLLAGLKQTMFVGWRYTASMLKGKERMNFHSPKSNHPRDATHWMKLPRHPKEDEYE